MNCSSSFLIAFRQELGTTNISRLHNQTAARSTCKCAGSDAESQVRLLRLLTLSRPHADCLSIACCLLCVCGRTAHLTILRRSCNLPHTNCRQTMCTLTKPIWVRPQPPRGGTADRQRYHILTPPPARPRSVDIVSGARSCTRQRTALVAGPLWVIPETLRSRGLTPVACRPSNPASRPLPEC